MTTRPAIDRLADIVERVEGDRTEVEDVALSRDDGEFVVDISLRLSPPPSTTDAAPHPAGATDGGTARANHDDDHVLPGTPAGPPFGSVPAHVAGRTPTGGAVHRSAVAARADGEREEPATDHGDDVAAADADGDSTGSADDGAAGAVECRVSGCCETFDTDHAMKIHAAKAHDDADERAPHRDPEQLRAVYEDCDTFEEMTDALGVDVTPQTVRRNMMSMGIHDPDEGDAGTGSGHVDDSSDEAETSAGSDDSGTADDAEPTDVSDSARAAAGADAGGARDADSRGGGGFAAEVAGEGTPAVPPEVEDVLPSSVDGRALAAAVREADTLYDVQEAIDVERETARSLLDELGLLELVHGRVATKPDRDDRKDEVERRLRERASGD